MCEANAYLKKKGEEEFKEFLRAVDIVRPTENGLELESVFGERKLVRADIAALHLVDHKILLEER